MRRTNLVSLIFVAAATFSTAEAAPSEVLTLEVSRTDFETWFSNKSAAVFSIDAYQLTSEAGILHPTTWQSIANSAASNPAAVTAALGSGALGFAEPPVQTSNYIAEVDLPGVGVWQPGRRWSIGYPFGASLEEFESGPLDVVFSYTGPSLGVLEGPVIFIPEPTTLALVAMLSGCLPQVRRRG